MRIKRSSVLYTVLFFSILALGAVLDDCRKVLRLVLGERGVALTVDLVVGERPRRLPERGGRHLGHPRLHQAAHAVGNEREVGQRADAVARRRALVVAQVGRRQAQALVLDGRRDCRIERDVVEQRPGSCKKLGSQNRTGA